MASTPKKKKARRAGRGATSPNPAGDLPRGVLDALLQANRDAIIVIDTKAANHTLPDGRNAHVSLHSRDWWRERLIRHFDHLEPVKSARRSRAAFRTWPRSPGQSVRFHGLRLRENAIHYAMRLVGRHKQDWKVSSTGHEKPG